MGSALDSLPRPFVIREELLGALRVALDAAGFPEPADGIALTAPKDSGHGDFTTNVRDAAREAGRHGTARRRGKDRGRARSRRARHTSNGPRSRAPGSSTCTSRPPGCYEVLRAVVAQGDRYGHGRSLADQRINLEFVSANPTGPIHAGAGRWVAVGDALANLLAAEGAAVHREYYLNDAGNQLDRFAASLLACYHGEAPPDDGYQGEYVVEMAGRMRAELGDDVTLDDAREWGYRDAVRGLTEDLGRIGVHFDTWFSERTLHADGAVDRALEDLRARGVLYEQDGATWLRSTDLGDQRDRVLVKSDGTSTYLLPDIAYHRSKYERGWEHLIDIWGADHHGQVKSLQVAMEALGYPAGEPEVLLGQLVKLERGGELVRLSKRAGNIITLADILDEVDPDVARLTFLLQSIDTQQTFDLDLVTSQSMENPVYYVQYAHARIASIGRRAAERGVTRLPILDADLAPLTHDRELELLRALAAYPDVVAEAAALARTAPHHHVGTRLRQGVPRLLPRLPCDLRRRPAHAGPAVAGGGVPPRSRQRARDPRGAGTRRDAPPRHR